MSRHRRSVGQLTPRDRIGCYPLAAARRLRIADCGPLAATNRLRPFGPISARRAGAAPADLS